MFRLYAYENHTIEGIARRFAEMGIEYRPSTPRWSRTSIHNMLTDRAYIGEILYRANWHPGKQTPLIDRTTWERVQALLGNCRQLSHAMTYAGDLLICGHCGHKITGELKIKQTKSGPREYQYYRCTKYNLPGHPRTRVTEGELDRQVLALFDRMRIEDNEVRDWFRAVLASKTKDAQADSRAQRAELQRQESLLAAQKDRLLNMRIEAQIDDATFLRKQTELRDRVASITLQLEALNRTGDENAELTSRVFELSQSLRQRWLTADFAEKRKILEIVWLNCQLNDVSLVPQMRKPFDILAEGLISNESGG